MFRLEAPYPKLASTVLLPSPEIGNNAGLKSQVSTVRMMDGSVRTSIKKADSTKLYRFDFTLSREKFEELADFVKRYRGATFRAVWRERKYIGKLSVNPVEFQGRGRAGGWPGGEAYGTTLELREE